MWQSISTAPYERDLELAVMDKDEPHVLVFARRIGCAGNPNEEVAPDMSDTRREWSAMSIVCR